jgi:hypothetical protein
MRRDNNESNERTDLTLRLAYTNYVEGAARAEPAVPAEDVQDSLNATV